MDDCIITFDDDGGVSVFTVCAYVTIDTVVVSVSLMMALLLLLLLISSDVVVYW